MILTTADPSRFPRFATAIDWLVRCGGSIPADLGDRIAALTAPVPLEALGTEWPDPREVVEAWTNTLSRGGANQDSTAWSVLLAYFVSVFDSRQAYSAQIAGALAGRATPTGAPLTLAGSWFEARRRLAGHLFYLGRTGRPTPTTRCLLSEAVQQLTFLIEKDRKVANLRHRRMYHGMRGVCHLLLARADEEPLVRYRQACADLEVSGQAGDQSAEWFEYISEAYLEVHERTQDLRDLERTASILELAAEQGIDTRGLSTHRGDLFFRAGVLALNENRTHHALEDLETAVFHFDHALTFPPNATHSDDYVRRKRGQARYRLFHLKSGLDGEKDEALLDAVLADLGASGADGELRGRGGLSLPWALYSRAELRCKRARYVEALDDLDLAESLCGDWPDLVDLRRRIRVKEREVRLRIAIQEEDTDGVLRHCDWLFGEVAVQERSTATLAHAGAFLARRIPLPDFRDFALRFADHAEAFLRGTNAPDSARSFAAGHAGRLLMLLVKQAWSGGLRREELSSLTKQGHDFFTRAIAHEPAPPPELLSNAAEIALRRAKLNRRLGNGGVREYLVDAAALWERALQASLDRETHSATFDPVVAHSKLGEVYVRLQAETGDHSLAAKAIDHLEHSRELGNSTPYLIGLLGDAYYRRGRARGDVDDLRTAVQLKLHARDLHDTTVSLRENRSLSAAAYLQIWRITGETEDLARACEAMLEARLSDPAWSWPLFQLADIARLVAELHVPVVQHVRSPPGAELPLRLVQEGDANALERIGCELAVQNREFEEQRIGGTKRVYVLRDPHRLLQQTIVLKETESRRARWELEAVTRFERYKAEHGAPADYLLPIPLDVVHQKAGASTYVMRRAQGVQLGRLVMDWAKGTGTFPIQTYRRTADFLAWFHAWGHSSDGPFRGPRNPAKPEPIKITNWSKALGSAGAEELRHRLHEAVPQGLPLLLKKDAHPENWIVTPRGGIVMLDLESSARRELLFELVQLVDDYPLLDATPEGWEARLDLARGYLRALNERGLETGSWAADVPRLYAAFALRRAAFWFGVDSPSRGAGDGLALPSPATRLELRREHYSRLVAYLEAHGPSAELRDSARFLGAAAMTLLSMPGTSGPASRATSTVTIGGQNG